MSNFQLPVVSIQCSLYRPASLTTTFFSDSLRCLNTKLSALSLHFQPRKNLVIRMGGGPRTFPGGVSKWQWKRMQAKKAKQLLKARLCRERQIYEMRKRAELKAAVSELERPWEVVERAPTLFSVQADEQLKVLADRFQKPGGFDMWSEKDGPQLFEPVDGLPSTRFFPKGVVHSIKPYAKFTDSDDDLVGGGAGEVMNQYDGGSRRRRQSKGGLSSPDEASVYGEDSVGSDSLASRVQGLATNSVEGKSRGSSSFKDGKKPNGRNDRSFKQDGARAKKIGYENRQRGIDSGSGQRHIDSGSGRRGGSEHTGPGRSNDRSLKQDGERAEKIGNENRQRGIDSGSGQRRIDSGSGRRWGLEHTDPGREQKERRRIKSNGKNEFRGSNGSGKSTRSRSDVYDMSLRQDGSYGF